MRKKGTGIFVRGENSIFHKTHFHLRKIRGGSRQKQNDCDEKTGVPAKGAPFFFVQEKSYRK